MTTDPMATVLDAAIAYTRDHGWKCVPIEAGTKKPPKKLLGWQNLKLTEADLPTYFSNGAGVGVLLGDPSAGLVDVDHDWPETVALATTFLPPTGAVFGRLGNPHSHRIYVCEPPPKKWAALDPTKRPANPDATVIEIRSTSHQTVFPPTVHESGERIEWDNGTIEPTRVSAEQLIAAVRRVAAGALLARYWPHGGRHALAIPLAGALILSEWPAERARQFIFEVARAGGDEEAPDRAQAVDTTLRRLANNEPIAGIPTMREHLDPEVVSRVCDWLGLGSGASHPYVEKPDGIYMRTDKADRRLTDFTARIVADVEEDDGVEVQHSVELLAVVAGRERRLVIPVKEFDAGHWASERLGAAAIVAAGQGVRDHMRAAIQNLSDRPLPSRKVYKHTGWRVIDGKPVFLHAGGAIGAEGSVSDVKVKLPDRLAQMELPDAPVGDGLRDRLAACLRFLDVAPDTVTIPLLAAAFRAPLGGTDYTVSVFGETGTGKTELLARTQQFFGAGFDRTHMPATFEDTSNAVGALAFAAKDVVLDVDDYAPSGSPTDVQHLNREAARLIRSQGNHSGRLRMKADSTLRESKDARGLLIMSGEDVPPGHSIRARMFVVQLPKNGVDWERMTEAQAAGERGDYASVMSAYIQWLAKDYDGNRRRFRELERAQRAELDQTTGHRRTPSVVASLLSGFNYFTSFARSAGVLTPAQVLALHVRAWDALTGGANEQAASQKPEDPCERFFTLLGGAIASQRAHVVGMDDGPPENPSMWGWQRVRDYAGDPAWEARGDKVGWLDGSNLYLSPEASHAAARRADNRFTITAPTLRRRLDEGGFLLSTEQETPGRDRRLTIRRVIAKARIEVLHVAADRFVDLVTETVPSGPLEAPTVPPKRPRF